MNSEREQAADMNDDQWAAEDFENTVAAALVACFESKVVKNRGAPPADRLDLQALAALRSVGPYIGSPSRIIDGGEDGAYVFDLVNDTLPARAVVAWRPGPAALVENPSCYFFCQDIRRSPALGKFWHRNGGGILFESRRFWAEAHGICGERTYFTVDKAGQVRACSRKIGVRSDDKELVDEWAFDASVTLQVAADRRFCWSISAQESGALAHLGCMQQEIKSLLYARSLPMTATGRKRPILHLVEAHKRRLRGGIDVDVTAFLRGQQVVEIGGTLFQVRPPTVLRPMMSAKSQRRFFELAD